MSVLILSPQAPLGLTRRIAAALQILILRNTDESTACDPGLLVQLFQAAVACQGGMVHPRVYCIGQ